MIPLLATSTTGLKPNDLADALELTVDENTPTSYSRIVATPSKLAAIATGLPFEVCSLLILVFLDLLSLCLVKYQSENLFLYFTFKLC